MIMGLRFTPDNNVLFAQGENDVVLSGGVFAPKMFDNDWFLVNFRNNG